MVKRLSIVVVSPGSLGRADIARNCATLLDQFGREPTAESPCCPSAAASRLKMYGIQCIPQQSKWMYDPRRFCPSAAPCGDESVLRTLKEAGLSAGRSCGLFKLASSSRFRNSRLLVLGYHGISLEDEHQWNPSTFLSPEVFRRRMRHSNGRAVRY